MTKLDDDAQQQKEMKRFLETKHFDLVHSSMHSNNIKERERNDIQYKSHHNHIRSPNR